MTECGLAEKIALLMESCLGCPASESDCPLNVPLIKAQRKLEAIETWLTDFCKGCSLYSVCLTDNTRCAAKTVRQVLEPDGIASQPRQIRNPDFEACRDPRSGFSLPCSTCGNKKRCDEGELIEETRPCS